MEKRIDLERRGKDPDKVSGGGVGGSPGRPPGAPGAGGRCSGPVRAGVGWAPAGGVWAPRFRPDSLLGPLLSPPAAMGW